MQILPLGLIHSSTDEAGNGEAGTIDVAPASVPMPALSSQTPRRISQDIICRQCGSDCRAIGGRVLCLDEDELVSDVIFATDSCERCGSTEAEITQHTDGTYAALCVDCATACGSYR